LHDVCFGDCGRRLLSGLSSFKRRRDCVDDAHNALFSATDGFLVVQQTLVLKFHSRARREIADGVLRVRLQEEPSGPGTINRCPHEPVGDVSECCATAFHDALLVGWPPSLSLA
jgi:hypothetical protein